MGNLDRIVDGLTYRDLAGRRRLRRYVLAAIAILVLLGGIVFWGWWQRQEFLAQGVGVSGVPHTVMADQSKEMVSRPVGAGVLRAEAQPSPTAALPAGPASTAIPLSVPRATGMCPPDSRAWELLEIS
ncbi:MAG TPA: hypothetical protein VI776_12465 [Anaerolineales bacterium]|nr:hypothetical protein [Anaerolineales bacterium]